MRIGDGISGLLSALLGLLVLWQVQSFPEIPGHFFGPGLFPSIIAWSFVLGGVLLILRAIRQQGLFANALAFPDWLGVTAYGVTGAVIMLVSIVLFILYGEIVGFQILAFATLITLYIWAQRALWQILVVPLVLTLMFDLLFGRLLRVPLPSGWLTHYGWW